MAIQFESFFLFYNTVKEFVVQVALLIILTNEICRMAQYKRGTQESHS